VKAQHFPVGKRVRIAAAVVATFVVAFAGSLSVSAAAAGSASSIYGNGYVRPYTYVNFSQINTTANRVQAVTVTGGANGQSITTGWAGARGRVFTCRSGALAFEGSNAFNPTIHDPAVGWSPLAGAGTGASFDTYGVSLGWNGSGYSSFYTYRTACQTS
jgi:hypothetical protein